MSDPERLIAALVEIVGTGLRQEQPYPVVVPQTAHEAVQCIRAARDHGYTVLPLGTGSSFSSDFSLRRDNVMAITTARLNGLEQVSPFATRVSSGTPISAILRGMEHSRKTVGGFICDAYRSANASGLHLLWSNVRLVESISGFGEYLSVKGPAAIGAAEPAVANIFIGSRGRIGFITAVEVSGLIPIQIDAAIASHSEAITSSSDCSISRVEIAHFADPAGLFQW